jgi:hypothetical protein
MNMKMALLILLNLTGNSLQIVICVFSEAHYVSAKMKAKASCYNIGGKQIWLREYRSHLYFRSEKDYTALVIKKNKSSNNLSALIPFLDEYSSNHPYG